MWACCVLSCCFVSTESPQLPEVQSQEPCTDLRSRLSGGAQLHTAFLTLVLGNSIVSFQQFLWLATACQEHGRLTISRSTPALGSVSLMRQQESRDPGQSTCRCQERVTAKIKLTLHTSPPPAFQAAEMKALCSPHAHNPSKRKLRQKDPYLSEASLSWRDSSQ